MSDLLFSIVIPTRDRNDLLALCLERLAAGAQDFEPTRYEVIVTDDSATGAARDLIAQKFSWAHWVAGPQRGPASNRNNGARDARGALLVFIDDDCLPEHDLLRAYAEHALRDDIAVYEGRITSRDGISSPMWHTPLNLDGGVLWSCNFAIRRAVFARVGGFDERFPIAHMEDIDLRERLLAAGYVIPFVRAAAVDHPPRRQAFGWTLARMHRASVLYMTLHPPRRSMLWFLQHQARERVARIRRLPFSYDTIIALASIPAELLGIAWHWNEWSAWANSLRQTSAE